MSFLTIYGLSVPVADGQASRTDESVRSNARAVDGSTLSSVSADLIGVDGTTTILTPDDAQVFRGLIKSRGDRWGFDFTNEGVLGSNPEYTAKGLAPSSGSVFRTRTTETVAESTSQSTNLPQYGDGCVEVCSGTTNLFDANVRDGSDTGPGTMTNLTALGAATVASSTADKWQGSRSVLVTCTALSQGLQANKPSGLSAATVYAGSAYLKKASGAGTQVKVYLQETAGGSAAGTSKTVNLSTTRWTRVEVSITTGAGVTGVGLRVEQAQAAAGGNINFYADGFQLEQRAFATPWTTTTTSAGGLYYTLSELQSRDDLTVLGWFRSNVGSSGTRVLWHIGDTVNGVRLVLDSSNLLRANIYKDSVLSQTSTVTPSAVTAPGGWFSVALSLRKTPVLGSKVALLVEGATQITASFDPPVLSRPVLAVGSDEVGGNLWQGQVDELIVLPYGLSLGQMASLYATPLTAWPDLLVSGDFAANDLVSVRMTGEVTSERFVQGRASGASFSGAMRSLGFKLVQSRAG